MAEQMPYSEYELEGRRAYARGEQRAPALNGAVRSALESVAIGDSETLAVMRAFTSGWDAAHRETVEDAATARLAVEFAPEVSPRDARALRRRVGDLLGAVNAAHAQVLLLDSALAETAAHHEVDAQGALDLATENRKLRAALADLRAADPDLFDPEGGSSRGAAYETYGSPGHRLRDACLAVAAELDVPDSPLGARAGEQTANGAAAERLVRSALDEELTIAEVDRLLERVSEQRKFTAAAASPEVALALVAQWGSFDGGHHKQWVLDAVVRALTGSKYGEWVADWEYGEDGHGTYKWDAGIAP